MVYRSKWKCILQCTKLMDFRQCINTAWFEWATKFCFQSVFNIKDCVTLKTANNDAQRSVALDILHSNQATAEKEKA